MKSERDLVSADHHRELFDTLGQPGEVQLTDEGLRTALFYTRVYARILHPAMAPAVPAAPPASPKTNADDSITFYFSCTGATTIWT
ncbi:MAG: hypothetical protein ACK5KM_00185 [Hyphomicrobiaceae bacterium]